MRQARSETCFNWSKEEFVGETYEETACKNAKALGGISVLDQVIDLITGE